MAPNKFSNARKNEKNGGDNEILGIILVIISAFMLLCIVIQPILGSISKAIAHVVLGLFGFVSYPMFLCTLILGIALIQDRKIAIAARYIFGIIILALCACIILQMATSHNLLSATFSTYISKVYNVHTAGGVLFGLIAYGVCALITPIASYIVFSLIIVLTVLFMVFPLFGKGLRVKPKKSSPLEKPVGSFVKGDLLPKTVTPVTDNALFVDTIKPVDRIENKQGTLETLDSKSYHASSSPSIKDFSGDFEPYNKPVKSSAKVSINESARQVLYGDTEKRIADLAARKYPSVNENITSSALSSEPLIADKQSKPMQKPPKKDHTSQIPNLPGVSIPPSKDFSAQIIGGDILNGEELSRKIAESMPKPASASESEKQNEKLTEKQESIIKPFAMPEKIQQEQDLDLPPITNGDYYSEQLEPKDEKIEPIIEPKTLEIPQKNTSSLQMSALDNAETRFSKLYEEEKNNAINANIKYQAPIINAEKDYLPSENSDEDFEYDNEPLNNSSEEITEPKKTAFNIDERVVDKSEKSHFETEDFTGYYEPIQDPNHIDLAVNNYKEFKADNSASAIRSTRQIKIDDYVNDPKAQAPIKKKRSVKYNPPPIDLLVDVAPNSSEDFNVTCEESARLLEQTLNEHKFPATVTAITRGPAVTRYELEIPPGIPVKRIEQFYSDIEYGLATTGKIRMEIPIHGKRAVGIEIPNEKIDIVGLKDIINSKEFTGSSSPITVALGKDIAGSNIICNLDKMPHLLIAGSTGSGKSACLNSIIISILYKASPEDVRLILIDPKHVEFTIFKGLPHLLTGDIITDSQQAYNALKWARSEMERRYILFGKYIVKNLQEFNRLDAVKDGVEQKIPYIVLIIDELAELMLSNNRKELEDKIVSMSQKARAAGIHLILATQRPTVDIITGTIKTNLPSRIAFAVKSVTDSRTILDEAGAEVLLGRGDMLYAPIGSDDPKRVQGAWVSNEEVALIADYVRQNNPSDFDADVVDVIDVKEEVAQAVEEEEEKEYDDIMPDVLKCVIETGSASTSMIQRRFAVGYARASRIIDQMELHKFIGPLEGSKPRAVYITREQYEEMFNTKL